MDIAPLSALAQPSQETHRLVRWAPAVVVAGIIIITLLHYLTSAHLLPYHSIYRTLYYVPITIAVVALGQQAGVIAAIVVILVYIPHVLGVGETLPGGMADNLLELPLFVLIAGLVGYLSDRERTLRLHTEHMRAAITAVLQSLPVGVVTCVPGAPPVAQNRTAQMLVATMTLETMLAPLPAGYSTLELGTRPIGVYVSPLQHGTDLDDERVYVLEDLTERRALEAQLRRMDRLASVGQLAAGIAHEIRNPLAILRATAQLLSGHLRADLSVATYTQVLTSESDRIEGLISQLLDYARPRPPVLVTCDLHTLLHAAALQISPYAIQHQVDVVVDEPQACAITIDEEHIKQALLNVLLNAVQASPPGCAVHLGGTCSPHSATLVVRDEGCGMAPHVQERACDPFFTTRADGTGLGLALVSAIVHEHAGSVTFASAVGRGTTVTLTLPQEEQHGERATH